LGRPFRRGRRNRDRGGRERDRIGAASLADGADGIVHDGAPAREDLEALQAVAGGVEHLRRRGRNPMQAAPDPVEAEDRPVLAMLLERNAVASDRGRPSAGRR
jgi:hypothetical protein